jgi:predicted transcriptional regulator
MGKIITEYRLETTYNQDKEELTQDKWKKISTHKSKNGWRKYYMDALDIYDNCNSNLENRMARYFIENIRRGFILEVNYKILMDKFECSDKKAKTFIKKMKDIGFIKGARGLYKTNPFMYIPYGEQDEDIHKAQLEWKNNN